MSLQEHWFRKLAAHQDMADAPRVQRHNWARWLISAGLFGLALVLLFYRLGDGSLHDWDEAIYAQVAKELSLSHDWGTLTWNGYHFFHKPPLYFWLTAVTYEMIGINELTARLWPATFGFGVVVLTFFLGVRLRSCIVGATAALLLLVVDHEYYGYWWNFLSLSRLGMLDTPLTFWIMLALVLVWEAERRPWLIGLLGLPVGMAVMTKAWPGLLAAAIPVIYGLNTRKSRLWLPAYWFIAALLAAIVILPWHLWQYTLHGPRFLSEYVGVNFTGRLFRSFEGHTGGPLDYLDLLRRGFSIWGYFVPLAYIWALWKALMRGDRRAWLLLSWITIPLVLFSMAQTKLGWYIGMIYPAVGLLMGLALAELFTDRLALSAIVAVMLGCCLRLPMAADGSHDVKQFALQAAQSVKPSDSIFVLQQTCTPPIQPSTAGMPLIRVGNIRPSLRFYLDNPLLCLEEDEAKVGSYPRHTYIISERDSWSRVGHLGQVMLEDNGFVLAKSD